jgi:hypothetical protein
MIQRAAVSTLFCVCFFASVAAAHPMRQFGRPSTQSTTPPTLQQILDNLVVSGPPIDAGAPTGTDLWTNSAASMTVQLVVDYTGNQGVRSGLYDPDNVSNPGYVLPNGITPHAVATVTFNADDSIDVSGGMHKTYTGFEGPFGFFIKTFDEKAKGTPDENAQFYYTQDALNPGGSPRALVFQGDGTTVIQLPGLRSGVFLPSQFLIAWETGLGGANDGQFNDYLILVSNVLPGQVPEPSFVLLLGISSLALLCGRRARSALK